MTNSVHTASSMKILLTVLSTKNAGMLESIFKDSFLLRTHKFKNEVQHLDTMRQSALQCVDYEQHIYPAYYS